MNKKLLSITIVLALTLSAYSQSNESNQPKKEVRLIKEAYAELTTAKDDEGGHRLKAIEALERFAKKNDVNLSEGVEWGAIPQRFKSESHPKYRDALEKCKEYLTHHSGESFPAITLAVSEIETVINNSSTPQMANPQKFYEKKSELQLSTTKASPLKQNSNKKESNRNTESSDNSFINWILDNIGISIFGLVLVLMFSLMLWAGWRLSYKKCPKCLEVMKPTCENLESNWLGQRKVSNGNSYDLQDMYRYTDKLICTKCGHEWITTGESGIRSGSPSGGNISNIFQWK